MRCLSATALRGMIEEQLLPKRIGKHKCLKVEHKRPIYKPSRQILAASKRELQRTSSEMSEDQPIHGRTTENARSSSPETESDARIELRVRRTLLENLQDFVREFAGMIPNHWNSSDEALQPARCYLSLFIRTTVAAALLLDEDEVLNKITDDVMHAALDSELPSEETQGEAEEEAGSQ